MTYPLTNIPKTLWVKVKAKATAEGHTIRFVLLKLLSEYVK